MVSTFSVHVVDETLSDSLDFAERLQAYSNAH